MDISILLSLSPWLEILYFLCAPILVIIGAIGLYQLKIAKDDISLRCRREAASLATLQCQRYYSDIIPLLDNLSDAIKKEAIPIYKGEIKEFCAEEIIYNMPKESRLKFLSGFEHVTDQFVATLNELESFSVYFVKGVGESQCISLLKLVKPPFLFIRNFHGINIYPRREIVDCSVS